MTMWIGDEKSELRSAPRGGRVGRLHRGRCVRAGTRGLEEARTPGAGEAFLALAPRGLRNRPRQVRRVPAETQRPFLPVA
jgi:hypothetical protein